MAAKESIEVTGDMLSIEVIDEREMQSPFGITDEEMRDLEEYIYMTTLGKTTINSGDLIA